MNVGLQELLMILFMHRSVWPRFCLSVTQVLLELIRPLRVRLGVDTTCMCLTIQWGMVVPCIARAKDGVLRNDEIVAARPDVLAHLYTYSRWSITSITHPS